MAGARRKPAAPGPAVRRCPCGSGESYDACCARLHRRQITAPTAEVLMRSRFAAFALADADYLRYSWHPSTRPASLSLDPHQRWTTLDILATTGGGLLDSAGTVEFRAHYLHRGQPESLHERSRFQRDDGRWLYLDGVASPGPSASRE